MVNVEDAEDAKKKGRMVLICVVAIAAMAAAIWSGFRSLDNRPRVTGTLGDAPPARNAAAPATAPAVTNDTPAGKRGE